MSKLKGIHNENIKYDVDAYTNSLIKEINRLYKSINYNNINARDNIILDCYSSVTIEGANTTIDNIKSNKKDKSTLMASNCIKGTSEIINKNIDITTEQGLISLWNIIVDKVCENVSVRGIKYRTGMVYVGKHTPVEDKYIQEYMNILMDYIVNSNENALIKACVAHFYFVYIHPFCDGNGRTARMLLSGILYKNGYHNIFATPVSNIIMNNIYHYYKSIEKAEQVVNGELNITVHINYMLEVILNSLKFISSTVDTMEIKIFNLINKHSGAEITVKKCANLLKINETTARNSLNKMVLRGKLIKYKNKNTYYYRKNLID